VMVWLPGWADLGTVIVLENVPVLLVVVLPTLVVSKVMVTVSLMPKLVPLTFTLDVGGPEVSESLMLALAANVTGPWVELIVTLVDFANAVRGDIVKGSAIAKSSMHDTKATWCRSLKRKWSTVFPLLLC